MSRGHLGYLPRPTKLADESYLDYVESFRKMLIQDMFPAFAMTGEARYQDWKAEHGKTAANDDNLDDIKSVMREMPLARVWQRGVRSQQEMMWRRTRQSFVREADKHMQALIDAEKEGPGQLLYDEDFVTPNYARQEIHLQPGGYTDDPLGGLVFHYGTKVFYEGYNNQDEHHAELAGLLAKPEGKLERILDVGCSIGQATNHLKQNNPEAEVIGLDVALPLLRYAHKCSAERGIDVTFQQALAEDTGYEDGSFDAVFSYIIFHELPIEVIPKVVTEMHRILRPGGTFTIFEFPNNYGTQLPPAQRFLIDYDSKNNCEPYSIDFVESNFLGMLEEAGFDLAEGPATSNPFLQSIIATKR
jgi:ubiquinone/menaquinone biosynthesis C-methylase UbiE